MDKNQEQLETKKSISKAASELFAANGYAGTSMRQIAKEAGVSLASINYHFRSKEDLYLLTIKEGHNRLHELLEKNIKNDQSFFESLREYYLTCKSEDLLIRNIYTMMTRTSSFASDNIQDLLKFATNIPGFKLLLSKCESELNKNVPLNFRVWLINNILVSVINWIIRTSSNSLAAQVHESMNIGTEEIVEMISMQAEALIFHANSKKEFPPLKHLDPLLAMFKQEETNG